MKNMKIVGTVLPSKETEAAGEVVYLENKRLNAAYAEKHFKNCDRRIVGSEVRFYLNETVYATIVDHSRLKVRWFEIRTDGYAYAMKTPPVVS